MAIVRTYTEQITNTTELVGLIQNLNTALDSLAGMFFVTVIFIILFVSLIKVTSVKYGFVSSSFISFLISYLLWLILLVPTWFLITYFFMMMGGGISLFINKE